MNIYQALKRVFVGRRLASAQLGETLLPKRLALPVFASDALSSVAYAPDEILITLSLAGMTGYLFSWQIGLAVGVVIAVVAMSYRQTVRAYPTGGGDYEVAASNLGRHAGLTVASALLVDYVLTVAVSVSAGVLNAKAMLPGIDGYEVPIAVGVIVVLALMNLRGVRDSGGILAWPTYVFMFSMLLMLAIGFFRILVLGHSLKSETSDLTVIGAQGADQAFGWVLVAIITRAFSSGCAALTGVEAVANGVPSFRPPQEPQRRLGARVARVDRCDHARRDRPAGQPDPRAPDRRTDRNPLPEAGRLDHPHRGGDRDGTAGAHGLR